MRILSFDVGIVNLAYCIFCTNTLKIIKWEIISLENTKDHCKLHVLLIKQLDIKFKEIINTIDIVLIEKQPSFNPKMRIIAGCLQSYFFIRGIVDSHEKPIKTIKFFSPKHKLKCFNGTELVISSGSNSKYSQTKKLGIVICRNKLMEYSETEEYKMFFENSKKKDDLADSYLQAITYSIFEKLINTPGNLGTPGNNKPVQIIYKKKFTKLELTNKIKEFIGESNSSEQIVELVNNYFENNNITTNLIEFPIDKSKLIPLVAKLNLKTLFNRNIPENGSIINFVKLVQ